VITIQIGKISDGSLFTLSFEQLPHLFVSYQNKIELDALLNRFLIVNDKSFTEFLVIASEDFLSNSFAIKSSTNNYIYNNPDRGSIKQKGRIFAHFFAALKKARKQQKEKINRLIIIDDIWTFVPKLNARAITQFKELLNVGAEFGFYFIIGSSMPYRNLLLQLMSEQSNNLNNRVLNQLGAEVIFNPDGLLFFRKKNSIDYVSLYPI
jgi:hypothetical protein